jgi:hypothetical protein
MQSNYNLRRQYLAGFSRITTSRLTEFRKLRPAERHKKKKDISPSDVDALLSSREDKPGKFAREVSFVDAQFQSVLSVYRAVHKSSATSEVLDVVGSLIRIKEDIEVSRVYSIEQDAPLEGIRPPDVRKETWKEMDLPSTSQGIPLPSFSDIGFKEVRIEVPAPSHEDSDEVKSDSQPGSPLEEALDDKEVYREQWENVLESLNDSVTLDMFVSEMMADLSATSKGYLGTVDNVKTIDNFLRKHIGLLYNGLKHSDTEWYSVRGYAKVLEDINTMFLKKFKKTESRKMLSELRSFLISLDLAVYVDPNLLNE